MAVVLGNIAAVENEGAIAALIPLLANPTNLNEELRYSVTTALGKIAVENEGAIAALIPLLANPNWNDFPSCYVAQVLGEIAVGNEGAISSLIPLLADPNLDKWLRCDVVKALGKIAVENEGAIAALIPLLANPNLNDFPSRYVVEALGEIAVGNEGAISVLVQLLANPNLHDRDRSNVAEALGKIDAGNPEAVAVLVKLLSDPNLHDRDRSNVAEVLGKILTPKTMPSAIGQLKHYVTDEAYNANFKQFESCYQILFKCAQTLPYPDLYPAWHPSLPIMPFDPTALYHQLNRPHTAILDLSNFHSSHSTDIVTELTTRIYLALQIAPIPTHIDTIPKLKQALINLNLSPHIVLICCHPHPTPELVREISNLEYDRRIQRIWLSDDEIDGALQPEQADLVAAIWAAIDRFNEG